jgi:hypothetical protein
MIATSSLEAERHWWAEVFGSGTLDVPLVCSNGQSGRGARDCPATTDLPVTMRLAELREPCDWRRSA